MATPKHARQGKLSIRLPFEEALQAAVETPSPESKPKKKRKPKKR